MEAWTEGMEMYERFKRADLKHSRHLHFRET